MPQYLVHENIVVYKYKSIVFWDCLLVVITKIVCICHTNKCMYLISDAVFMKLLLSLISQAIIIKVVLYLNLCINFWFPSQCQRG
jgi:hypothetical protein